MDSDTSRWHTHAAVEADQLTLTIPISKDVVIVFTGVSSPPVCCVEVMEVRGWALESGVEGADSLGEVVPEPEASASEDLVDAVALLPICNRFGFVAVLAMILCVRRLPVSTPVCWGIISGRELRLAERLRADLLLALAPVPREAPVEPRSDSGRVFAASISAMPS